MKQPQRLMQSGSPRARALLASLDEDVPPDPAAGQERILRALDVPTGIPSGPASSQRIRVAPPTASRRWLPIASIASIAGIVAVCATGWTMLQRHGAAEPSSASAPAVELVNANANPAPAAVEPAPSSEEPSRGVDVHALASAPLEARAPRASARRDPGTAAAPTATAGATTADELQLLERAQAAAARGQSDEALSLVAVHRREFPRGRFGVEMSVVEIEALARSGRVDEAAARGERFLASHPGSPYTRRVEAVVRSPKEQPR